MSITRMADCEHGASFDSECPNCGYQTDDEFTARSLREQRDRYRAALRRIASPRHGIELSDNEGDAADYWSAVALEYRKIAREALAGGAK